MPITSLTNQRERVFLNDSPAITRKMIANILTKRGFSLAYLNPSLKGIFFFIFGIGSGTFQIAMAAKIGRSKIGPFALL